MPVTLHKDTKKLDAFLEAMKKAAGMHRAEVGIFQSKAGRQDNEGTDNVDLAVIHEFGAPDAGIPERSHFRSTLTKNRDKYLQLIKQLTEKLLKHPEGIEDIDDRVLGIVGEVAAGDVKQAIADGLSPELKPATIKRKGSSTPLIDSGGYRNSITQRVVRGGETDADS